MADQPSVTAGEQHVAAHEEWLGEPEELLPRRPRRRLIGVGGNALALALLGVLLAACGFIGGVLIEKGETSSSSSGGSAASSLISRFRSLRGGGAGGGSSAGFTAASGSRTGFARPTAGTVAYLAGHTLYVTNAEGNTLKIITSAATSVTKTVKSSVKGIHPGETVTVTGEAGANGTVSAESISVGGGGGALSALFGSGGAAATSKSAGSSRGEPSLFGG
jgi:DNA-binding beta-propeller fold protein YncE